MMLHVPDVVGEAKAAIQTIQRAFRSIRRYVGLGRRYREGQERSCFRSRQSEAGRRRAA